ncbi:unnamed protein product [Nippostrongylus brasiliensis]|uniref:G_PROTEIN_RECEP_F1_2 domain-containing protein n=1 Tax=Nippostrongylus brasiliensis TaxID=27835 RepID=A0A0N4YGR3_NIPBR|nr:unnamed protein product [Nippostrongylus brasiliensis]
MANFSHVCLTEQQQMMNGTPLEYNLQRYVYPAIAVFGILGNVLNLTVLLNRSMRSRLWSYYAFDSLLTIPTLDQSLFMTAPERAAIYHRATRFFTL